MRINSHALFDSAAKPPITRGWKELADKIDDLPGTEVVEGDNSVHRVCRLLVGMQRRPVELLEKHFDQPEGHLIDNSEVNKQKRLLADEFKRQLTMGHTPRQTNGLFSNADGVSSRLRRPICREVPPFPPKRSEAAPSSHSTVRLC